MPIPDSDVPDIINTIDLAVAKLRNSKGENMNSRNAAQEFNDALGYLEKLGEWFRTRLDENKQGREYL